MLRSGWPSALTHTHTHTHTHPPPYGQLFVFLGVVCLTPDNELITRKNNFLTVRLTVKYRLFLRLPYNLFVSCVRFASSKHKVFVPVHICICLVLLCRRAQGHQDCGWVTFCYNVWQHPMLCEKYFKHSLCHHAITCGDMGQHSSYNVSLDT